MVFGSSDPVKQEEKLMAKEAKRDDAAVKNAIKDLERTEKAEHAAEKEHASVLKDHAKAAEKEHKLAEKANNAVHKHETAASHEHKLAEEVRMKEERKLALEKEVQAKKEQLENIKHKHDLNDAAREDRRHQVHNEANPVTATNAGSTTTNAAPVANTSATSDAPVAGQTGLGNTTHSTGAYDAPGTTSSYVPGVDATTTHPTNTGSNAGYTGNTTTGTY